MGEQSHMSDEFVASLAQLLNAAQVPCVLWGHFLLCTHGVPTIVGEIDFVVPDELLSAATRALGQHEMLLPCKDGKECRIVSPKRCTPAPDSHLHIEGTEVPVGLFIQSVTLWFLPPLEAALITPEQGQLPAPYALASDESILPTWRPERGAGVFKPGAHPVVIVRSHVLLEAFMRICARTSHTLAGSFSNSMVLYMSMYVDDDGYLDLKQLPEPLVSSYLAYTTTKISGRQWLAELRQMFGEPALLPEEE